MKRLNIKFLALLLVPLICVAIGIYFLHGSQVSATEQMWLDQAKKYEEKGQYREALEQLTKFLRVYPDDLERTQWAAELAADVFLGPGIPSPRDLARARRDLEKAARNTVSDPERRRELERRLIEVFMSAPRYDDAHGYIQDHLKVTPADVELTYYAARCAIERRLSDDDDNPVLYLARITGFLPNKSEAPYFDEEAALDIHHVDAYMLLATYYQEEKGDAHRADQVIDGMFAANKEFGGDDETKQRASKAWFNRGRYRQVFQTVVGTQKRRDQQKKKAREEIEMAVKIDAANEAAQLTIAELHVMDGDLEGAKEALLTVLEHHPESINAYKNLANLAQDQSDIDGALKAISDGLVRHPENVEFLWKKFSYQLVKNDRDGVRETIELMVKAKAPRHVLLVAKAILPTCDGDWDKAARMLENVKPLIANHPPLRKVVNQSLANCYRQTNERDRSLAIYQEMAEDPVYGGSDNILLHHVTELISQRRMDEAWKLILPRITNAENPEDVPLPLRNKAREIFRWRERNEIAAEAFGPQVGISSTPTEDIEGNPKDWVSDDDFWRKVHTRRRRLVTDEKGEEAISFFEGALDVKERHLEQLPEDEQERAIAAWTDAYYFYVGMVFETRGPDQGGADALKALATLKQKRGDSPRVVIESARIISRNPGRKSHNALKLLEPRIASFATDQRAHAWLQLAQAYIHTGSFAYDDAKRCWQEAIRLAPTHKPTLQQSLQLSQQTQDSSDLLEVLDAIETAVTSRDPLWKYARAYYLLASLGSDRRSGANIEEATTLIEQVMTTRPNWAAPYELRGQIRDLTNDSDAALQDFEEARRLGSRNPHLIARVMDKLIAKGKFGPARAVLDAMGPTFPGLERHRAYLRLAKGADLDGTIKSIEQFESTGWNSYIEKGDMYRMAIRRFSEESSIRQLHEKAEVAYRTAVDIASDNPATWLTLIRFLVGTKRSLPDAEAVLRKAESDLPDDIARSVMAQGYFALRDYDQAKHYLLAMSASYPDNLAIRKVLAEYYAYMKQEEKSIGQLKQMLAIEDGGRRENIVHVMWARRQLANILLRTRDHDDFLKALEYIEANQRAMPRRRLDSFFKAQALANRPEPRYRREAMKLLESIYEADPQFLNLQSTLLLSRLYYQDSESPAEERWIKSNRLMDRLLDEQREKRTDRTPRQEAMLLVQRVSMLLDRGEISQANRHIQVLRVMQPNAPHAIRLLAKWHLARKDRKSAEEAIAKLVPAGPLTEKNAPMLLQAAHLFDEQNLDDRATTLFRRLAAEYPAVGKIQLAEYLANRGTAKEANEAVAIAQEIASENTAQAISAACHIGLSAVRQLGNNATQRHRDTVAGWFRRGQAIDGNRDQILRIRLLEADFSILVNDHSRATEIFRELLQRPDLSHVEEGQIANNFAYLLAARGKDLDEAKELVNRAMRLIGPTRGVLDTKSIVHLVRDECEDARRSAEEATCMNAGEPGFVSSAQGADAVQAQMYFHLALAYQCNENKELARKAWKTSQSRGFRTSDMKPLKRDLHDQLLLWLAQ